MKSKYQHKYPFMFCMRCEYIYLAEDIVEAFNESLTMYRCEYEQICKHVEDELYKIYRFNRMDYKRSIADE